MDSETFTKCLILTEIFVFLHYPDISRILHESEEQAILTLTSLLLSIM